MAISTGGGGDDAPMSEINTTPLVDVMLVLLIIFLIAVPVAIQTIERLEIPVFESIESKDKVENLLLTVSTTDSAGRSAGILGVCCDAGTATWGPTAFLSRVADPVLAGASAGTGRAFGDMAGSAGTSMKSAMRRLTSMPATRLLESTSAGGAEDSGASAPTPAVAGFGSTDSGTGEATTGGSTTDGGAAASTAVLRIK